jgi:RNA polymerase sigma-70 factor (ECF subfamily)
MALRIPFLATSGLRARIEEHRKALYRVAFSWCHQPALADDLVQETMLRALAGAEALRDPARLKGWLFVIMGNCFRDHLRRQRPAEDLETIDEVILATVEGPDEIHERSRLVSCVRKAIEGLPLGQRQVITLVDLEGFGYAEVARILDVPIGTVMSRLCRGRQALRERLIREPQAVAVLRSVK